MRVKNQPWEPGDFAEYLQFYTAPKDLTVGSEVTPEFKSIWKQNAEVREELSREYEIIWVRGLFGKFMYGNLIRPRDYFAKRGFVSELAPVGSGKGVLKNGQILGKWLKKRNRKKIVFLAHSKGGLDILSALASHPELEAKTAGLALVQTPVGPSAVMDSILHNRYPNTRDRLTAFKENLYLKLIRASFHEEGCRSISSSEYEARNAGIFTKTFSFPILSVISWSIYPSSVLDAFHKRLARIRPGHANDGQFFLEDQIVPGAEAILLSHIDHAQPALGNMGFDSLRFWKTLFLMLDTRIQKKNLTV